LLFFLRHWFTCFTAIALLLGAAGCKTNSEPPLELLQQQQAAPPPETVRLNPGDVVQITFPGAPKMDTAQRIRLDGNIQLPLVGDVLATGKTPVQLQDDLVKLYDKELQIKQVLVVLSSSSASIYVTGAVNRPGRITMERPLTVLDAMVEAGGFDPKKANIKKVSVIRQKNGHVTKYRIDLRPILKGEGSPFKLEPFDIIYVPEKIF
jgi:polysaccharide export outer membrane protein